MITATLISGAIAYATYKFFFGLKGNNDEQKDLEDRIDDITTQVMNSTDTISHVPIIIPEQFLQKTQASVRELEKQLENIQKLEKSERLAIQKKLTQTMSEIDSLVIRSNNDLEFVKQLSRLYGTFFGNDTINIQEIYQKLGFNNNHLGIQASYEEVMKRIQLKAGPIYKKMQCIFSDKIAKDNFDAMIQGKEAVKSLLSKPFSSQAFINLIALKRVCAKLIQKIADHESSQNNLISHY